jgi:hypothetical protein
MFSGPKYKQIWTNSTLFTDIIPKLSFISFIFYFPISSNPFIHIEQVPMKNNLENAITFFIAFQFSLLILMKIVQTVDKKRKS